MAKRWPVTAAVGVATASCLVACLSACASSAITGPTPTPAASSVFEHGALVGVVLPDDVDARWRQSGAVFSAAMPGVTVRYGDDTAATEQALASQLMTQGVRFLVVCPVDPAAAAPLAVQAHAVGATVISYDRMIEDTSDVDYFVGFDPRAVGAAQAQYLVDQAQGKGNHLYLYAGPDDDPDTLSRFEGAWDVLQPKLADGTFVVENSSRAVAAQDDASLTNAQLTGIIDQIGVGQDTVSAQNVAQVDLAQADVTQKGTVYLLAPSDDAARAVVAVFRADKDVTTIFSTGEGFTQASLQDILDGKQSMTIWRPPAVLVDDVAQIVSTTLAGAGRPDVVVTTRANGAAAVPATKAPLTIVVKANAAAVIAASGVYTLADGKVVPR